MTKTQKTLSRLSLAAVLGFVAVVPVSHAFNFGNMMNPSRWMNGNDRYDDEPYYGGPYGMPFGSYGYPGAYGAPYGGMPYGAPGFGAPPAAYGAPAYGAAPGMTPSAPAAAPTPSASQSEIEALKRRIEELESKQQTQRPQGNEWPSAPAFRPMNQY
ncbi:hypothetical protein [Thiorhodococcus fuscus]|uniref:Sulfur globule protein CV1 n=1 Tax=Thiorhodococcus fuscus TaxID=527200 RepID=A0ABW4Y5V9_9GAMM